MILELLTNIRKKLEDDEFSLQITPELKGIVEELLTWLEAYNLTKPTELRELVKTLWSNLPTSSSFNIPFNEINPQTFTKQLFGSAYVLPPNLSPFFLGSFQTQGAAIVFFTNAYRCLNYLLASDPSILYRLFEAGLLSHLRQILLSLSNCLQQWTLPNLDPPENFTPKIVSHDYYMLLFQILKLSNKMMQRLILTNKTYDDPITLSSVLIIFSHIINESLEFPCSLKKSILNEILGFVSSWAKQDLNVLLITIAELLFDLPIKRITAIYLLMSITGIFSIKECESLKIIEKFLTAQNPLMNKETRVSIIESSELTKNEITTHLIRTNGCLLNYMLNQLYESYDAEFVTVGVCMVKHIVNTLSHEFAKEFVIEFSTLLFTYGESALRIDELDLGGTSSPDNKLIIGLCRRLFVLNELIPTMLKYALIRSELIDKAITMFRSIGIIRNNPSVRVLERLFLQCLKNFCTLDSSLMDGRSDLKYAIHELLPTVPQMQKIISLLSQRAIIDPHTFTGLSNNSITEPLVVLEYLNVIKVFVSNPIGRSIALFGDYLPTYPSVPRINICFKELIDQCHELLKLNVPIANLVPIVEVVVNVALALTTTFDEYGIVSGESKEIPGELVNAIACVLAGDSNNVAKFAEKLNDFLLTKELADKWEELVTLFSLKEFPPASTIEIYESRTLDEVYQSHNENKLSQPFFEELLKPKTVKKAEYVYLLKHNSVMRQPDSSLIGIAMKLSNYEKFQDDWLVEHLSLLESSVIAYFSNADFIVSEVYPRVKTILGTLSEPVKLEVEHENLLLSIQAVKRRQRIEVEKKRNARTKATPAASKINAINTALSLTRKVTSQQPSRNISTHVDVFEGLDKGTKNPFPQAQKVTAKPSTPTHAMFPITSPMPIITPMESAVPQAEERPAIPTKHQDIINLLKCLSKTSSSRSNKSEGFPPPIFISNQKPAGPPLAAQGSMLETQGSPLRAAPISHESAIVPPQLMLTEEEKDACRRIQYLKMYKLNDPRGQEQINWILRQHKRIAPYLMNFLKKP